MSFLEYELKVFSYFLSRMANYAERQRATGKAQSQRSQTPEILIFLAVLQEGFSCL